MIRYEDDLEIGDLIIHEQINVYKIVSEPKINNWEHYGRPELNWSKGYDIELITDIQLAHGRVLEKGRMSQNYNIHTRNWSIHPITLRKHKLKRIFNES